MEKEERELNVLEIYIRYFFDDENLTELTCRDFKICINKLDAITNDTIEGMNKG